MGHSRRSRGQIVQSLDHAIHADEAPGLRPHFGQSCQVVLPASGLQCGVVLILDEPEHQLQGVCVPGWGRSNPDVAERAEGMPLVAPFVVLQ